MRNGGKSVQDYKGPREADGIVEYLKKLSGPASAEIKSSEDAGSLISENKIVVVSGLWLLDFCLLFFFFFFLGNSSLLDFSFIPLGWTVPKIFWRRI